MIKTINDLYLHYSKVLNSELEARELIAFALQLDRTKPLEWGNIYITEESEKEVLRLVSIRQRGKPLAYILGEWEFYSLTFKVNENVLIPRADTEILVDRALDFLKEKELQNVLDLCSGSGCIGITIAHYIKDAQITACDISPEALEVAKYNAKLNGISTRYKAFECNVLSPTEEFEKYDLIVSNPPYIETNEIVSLDIDVKDYEPIIALDGGIDGLDFYRAICKNFIHKLNPNGQIMFEYGIGQDRAVEKLLKSYNLCDIIITKDLNGIRRVIQATKPEF